MSANRSLLIACYEVPGWGGASSRAYLLFERLQREGWNVAHLNLVRGREEAFLRALLGDRFGNPRALPGVHTLVLDEPVWGDQPKLAESLSAIRPDAVLAFGFTAANLLRPAFSGAPLVFATVGAGRVQSLVEAGAVADFMAFRAGVEAGMDFPPSGSGPIDRERQAVEASDRIVVHSPLVRFALERCFPAARRKIHPSTISLADLVYENAEPFAALRRPFGERDIDALFIASDWRRPVKNYALVRAIGERSAGRAVHVVGAVAEPCPNAIHHGVVTERAELFALLGRSRTLVCPSLVDAAPGVLFEASAMGCNIVASPNCGNWELCNDDLLARSCEPTDFVERIERSLARPYADCRERFCGGYEEMSALLAEL